MLSGVNWLAISGIATFVLAFVAVIPIFGSYFRRRRMAHNLRRLICHYLLLARPYVGSRLTDEAYRVPFNIIEQEPVKALEQLFSQAHILKSQDHDSIGSNLLRLSAFSRMDNPEPEDAEKLLSFLDEAIKQFGGERHLP